MRPMRWFLPETPDVLGTLREQARVTIEAMDSLVAWASGESEAAERVRGAEHRADDLKRRLRNELRTSFVTPIGAEDLFVLSQRLDQVLNAGKDALRESEVMAIAPDEGIVGMAALLAEGVHHLADAFDRLGRGDELKQAGLERHDATDAADAAIKAMRQLERVYRLAMSALLDVTDMRAVMGRRELYRRFSRMSEDVIEVAERVWYASVKEA